jgi:hypothetical protein
LYGLWIADEKTTYMWDELKFVNTLSASVQSSSLNTGMASP